LEKHQFYGEVHNGEKDTPQIKRLEIELERGERKEEKSSRNGQTEGDGNPSVARPLCPHGTGKPRIRIQRRGECFRKVAGSACPDLLLRLQTSLGMHKKVGNEEN